MNLSRACSSSCLVGSCMFECDKYLGYYYALHYNHHSIIYFYSHQVTYKHTPLYICLVFLILTSLRVIPCNAGLLNQNLLCFDLILQGCNCTCVALHLPTMPLQLYLFFLPDHLVQFLDLG